MSAPTHLRRKSFWAEHPSYSRPNLGSAVYGEEYDRRLCEMENGSKALLQAIWHSHQRVMLVAKAHGRLVVQP